MIARVITVFIGIAALAAAVISFNLTMMHLQGSSGMSWFDSLCGDQGGAGSMNCAKVMTSPYSYVPPKKAGQSGGLHVPAAFLGLVYYSILVVWMIGVGRPSFSRRWIHAVPVALVAAGLLFSAWFIYVMASIAQWCPWCVVTHGLNLLIFIGLVAIWPRKGDRPAFEAEVQTGATVISHPRHGHPSDRLLITTVLAVVLVIYGHLFAFEWLDSLKSAKHMRAELDYMRSNVGPFVAQWQLAPECGLMVRPDDPVETFSSTPSETSLNVVIFSDFECPGCGQFSEFFARQVPPLFDNQVRVVFRHFPLDQSCNPKASRTLHPHACAMAALAEAARTVGGNASFWKAHDFLFKHRSEIAAGGMNAEKLGLAIGLDPAALSQVDAEPLKARIAQDADQAAACRVGGTPSVFVEGKKIDSTAAFNPEFWDKLADWYWLEKAKKERPASTRPVRPPGKPAPGDAKNP